MKTRLPLTLALLGMGLASGFSSVFAQTLVCPVTNADLISKLQAVVASPNGGLGNQMWAVIVNRDGVVCNVVFSGANRGEQWPASRVIAAQKANTANALSLPTSVLSTANLYTAVQPGGILFSLQASNPLDPSVIYRGNSANYGQFNDPLVGNKPGGVNVFGGGLALYNIADQLVGGLGVSGDTSCTDHIVAWKLRFQLDLDHVPDGVAGVTDNIIHDFTTTASTANAVLFNGEVGSSTSGFGHPTCDATATTIAVGPTGITGLPTNCPVGGAQPPTTAEITTCLTNNGGNP